jgi:hypothetical protein
MMTEEKKQRARSRSEYTVDIFFSIFFSLFSCFCPWFDMLYFLVHFFKLLILIHFTLLGLCSLGLLLFSGCCCISF